VQSGAIIRYVAKLSGVYPEDIEQAAIGDMVVELCLEMNAINPLVNWFDFGSDAYNASYSAYFGILDARLESLQRILGAAHFFGGENVCHGDFVLFHVLDSTLLVKPDSLAAFPQLRVWIDQMNAIPQLTTYLRQRPQPPLVGKEGSFIRSLAVA
jgi:glutathione S-transferase